MIPAPQYSTSTKDMGHLDLVPRPSPDPSLPTAHHFLTEISNIDLRSSTITVNGTSVNNLHSPLLLSCPAIHVGRVAIAECHDTDTWTQEWKFHDTKLDAVAASSSLGPNNIVSSDPSPVSVAGNSLAVMDPRTQDLRNAKRVPNATPCEEAIFRPYDWTTPHMPGSGISAVRPSITNGPCSHEGLSEGRRRVGEILVRCGVINVSGMSPIESTTAGRCDDFHFRPVDALVTSTDMPIVESDEVLITALADWTSEWMHTLVVQPYLRGSFRFQYQRKPSNASTSIASRIRRVLNNVYNPVQVAIHALWLISTLTRNGVQDNVPFLSVPIFRYLHNNGTFATESFMFRTFVACAMIADKTVNDAPLAAATWNRLSHIPQVILNATEKYALNCLKWNVVMTQTNWQDTIIYLRSCIKMGSVFDPFAYEEDSALGIVARHLDELISLSYADEAASQQAAPLEMEILAPRPIRSFTHWEVLDNAEWCPEDDPIINQKPRINGIAPGADQSFGTLRVGTTAKDLLDSILGSSTSVADLAHFVRSPGTFLSGSLGAIGARFTRTIGIAHACQTAT